jgi:hypothetical protein
MARLARLRLVSVGHPSARFGDLVLDFRDAAGHATDATLWLRNGGGKSSLLNLFFALVRPDRREFLGNRAEAKQRRLEDYVLSRDRGLVVGEWELDTGGNGVPEPAAYLTGVFYEWGGASGADAGQLKRLFFAGKRGAGLSIDQLPIVVEGNGYSGKPTRRSMTAFRAELAELREREPDLEVFWTTTNREWTEHLVSVGIDPELFTYQIRMNQREGAADEVFRFVDHDQFVDFLLGLALDPALGDGVTANIGTFRNELRDRKDQWLPEIDLVGGMIERLSPLIDVRAQRAKWIADIAARGHEFTALMRVFESRTEGLARELEELAASHAGIEARLTAAREVATHELQIAAALRAHAAKLRHQLAAADTRRARADLEAATHKVRRWEAAVPLWAARRFAASAAGYVAELERKREQFAPDLGELKLAATRFASALRESVGARREEIAADVAAAAEARRRADEHRAAAAERGAQASQARERVRGLDERLAETRVERARLEADGVVQPGEAASDATARHGDATARLAATVAAHQTRDRDLAAQVAAHHGERANALAEAARSEERARRTEDELAAALRVRGELEQSDELRHQLETESVDATRLPPGIVHRIHDAARHAREHAIGDRVAQLLDERAVLHLEAEGLLPPTRDVDAVLGALRGRVHAVWSGWAYLESHVPRGERASFVRELPAVVDGVVIADEDFERASELLAQHRLELDGPVTIARESAFGKPELTPDVIVIGPTGEGRFDRAAAESELRARRARLQRYDESIKHAETRAGALQRLALRVEQFFERYPGGWFAEREQRVAAERAAHARHAGHAAGLETTIAAIAREREELATRIAAQGGERTEIERKRARAAAFVARAQHEEAWERERATAAATIEDHEQAVESARGEAQSASEAAETAERRAAAAREDAAVIEVELRAIEYAGDESVDVAGAPLEDLRQDYRRRKDVYEDRVGEDALDQLAAADQAQAAVQRARFERLARQYDLTEDDASAVLDALGDSDSPEDRLRDANEARASANGVLGQRTTAEARAKEKLEEATRHRDELDAPALSALPEHAEVADRDAHEAEQRAFVKTREAQQLEDELDAASSQITTASRALELVKEARKRATSISAAYGDVLAAEVPADHTLELRDDQISDAVDGIETVLRQARSQLGKLDAARANAVRSLRSFAGESRFEALKSLLAKKLVEADPEDLERLAEAHVGDLAARRQQLEAQIASIDRHRETLVTEALNAAEEGLALLRSAANQSRLPEHVPGLGGAQFLRITTHTVDDLAERRARIATLIDEVCDAGQLPSGLALVQRAVRRLARPIKVYVLHPDPARGRESVEIPEITRCSGGEQLTSAILLYCTLAQVRARSRGAARKGTSTLILDNPIGRASRARFLELQREVARTMGVQLIYTTGVNDYDALRALPKIIRLRNQRVDRGSGHQVVELEDEGIEAIQLGRLES